MKLKLNNLMLVSFACFHIQLSAQEANQAEMSIASLPAFDCIIKPGRVVDIGTAVPGVIEEVFVDIGDFVHKGMPLSKLDLSVERASLELARAKAQSSVNIELRKEQADYTIRSKKRSDQLYAKSLISSQNIDQAETEQRVALLQLQDAKNQSAISQLDFLRISELLKQGTIRSPIEGVVMDRFKSAGEYVKDTPLMRVAQLHPLHVEVIIPVEYMGMINSGVQADVTPSVLGYTSKRATVERIDRVADTASGTFGVRLNLPNEDKKIPGGLRCKMAFVIDSAQDEELAQQSELVTNEVVTNEASTNTADASVAANTSIDAEILDPVLESVPTVAGRSPNTIDLAEAGLGSDSMKGDFLEASSESILVEAPLNNTSQSKLSPKHPRKSPIDSSHVADKNTQDASNLQCFAIGPLKTEESALAVSNKLNDIAQSLTARASEILEIKDYQVLSKQQQDQASVVNLKARYLQAGIKNLYVLREGDSVFSSRLSLGAFGVRANAEAHQARLVKLGFEPEIVPRKRARNEYWLDMMIIESAENTNSINEVVQHFELTSVLSPKACSTNMKEQLTQNM